MKLGDVGMLAVSSNRTRMYLQQLAQHNLLPSFVLYLEGPGVTTPEYRAIKRDRKMRNDSAKDGDFVLRTSVLELLQEYCIPHKRLPTLDPNAASVVAAIRRLPQSILVYSGPGGVILRKDILSTGKRFLHVHSGILPYFRGSTTVYYALLEEGRCGATAFFFDEKIDTGPVIRTRAFPPPEDRTSLDLFYDPLIRSQLLVDVLRDYAATGKMPVEPQDPEAGETYFVIHPVLKHIAILAGESKPARASGATVQESERPTNKSKLLP